MSQTSSPQVSYANDTDIAAPTPEMLPCVLTFNANDPVGAGGLSGDALVIASMGAHTLPVVTGALLRDSRDTMGYAALEDANVMEQARMVAEDVPLQFIKVGFLGNPEIVAAVAAFVSDYPNVPVVAYMPDLSWWSEHEIDDYLDAFAEMLLPQTTVLVGNNSTLRHWLLPESTTQRHTHTVNLARAAGLLGSSYVLVTGVPLVGERIGNILASPQAELVNQPFERMDIGFMGAGDILSAALAALLAIGLNLSDATREALNYLDQALDHGFRPGMGRMVADRLFWANMSDNGPSTLGPDSKVQSLHNIDISNPTHDTKH